MRTGPTLVAAVLALLFAGCAAHAATRVAGRHVDITFPVTSPVSPVPSDEPGGRRFAGSFTMTGHFRFEAGTSRRDAVLEFFPDRDIALRLPYFADLGPVQRIAFDNPATFVEDAIPAATITRLAKGELTTYSGRARIVVEGYFASVHCDQPGYTVTFVEVEWVGDAETSIDPAPAPDGC